MWILSLDFLEEKNLLIKYVSYQQMNRKTSGQVNKIDDTEIELLEACQSILTLDHTIHFLVN